MKKLLLTTILISGLASGQEKTFILNKESFTDYIVTDIKGFKKDILYKKTLEWIAKTYNSGTSVIKSDVKNDFIRFEGMDRIYCEVDKYSEDKHTYCYPTKYTIEISFKDGKYKFDVISLRQYYNDGTSYDVYPFIHGYGNKSEKDIDLAQKIPHYFNDLNSSLSNYIIGKKKDSDKW